MIPRSGFGYSSHMKAHVRRGEARMEWNEQYKCNEFHPTKEFWGRSLANVQLDDLEKDTSTS